ncbi:MAG: hypothetical protein WBV82_03310 [Myxococcaceae bacterium]
MRHSQFLMAVVLPASLLVGCGQEQLEADVSAADLQQTEQGLITTATPQRLAQLESYVTIQTSATHVYFNDFRTIRRVPKAGGAVETILSAPEEGWLAWEFALDDKYVWVGVIEDLSEPFGHVVKVPLAGGEPVKSLGGAIEYSDIAVDATFVYLAIGDQVLRFPKEGLFFAPEVIASGQSSATSLAVDGSNVYWIDMGSTNPANGCNPNEGRINAWNKFTGATRVLASGENCPLNLVLDGSSLYWGTFGSELRKTSTWSYSGFPQTVARGISPFAIAADASYLYTATEDSQASYLMAVGKFFGTRYIFPNTREGLSEDIFGLVADAQHVYYVRSDVESGSVGLFKLRK